MGQPVPEAFLRPMGHHLHGVSDAQIEAVISKCWQDSGFRLFLMDHPVEALRSQGISIPVGVRVKAFESSAAVMHLVIPQPPQAKT